MRLKDNQAEIVSYDYTDYPIYLSRSLLSSCPNYSVEVHWHDDIEFIAVISGKMQYSVNGEIVTLQGGEGVFVNTRQLHFGFSSEKNECDFLCARLHPMLLCSVSAFEQEFVMPVLNNSGVPFIKLTKNIDWHQKIYRQICFMCSVKNEKTAPMKVQSAFVDIWTLIFENIPIETKKKPSNNELTVIKNMISFIQRNYGEKISLSGIAASGAVGQSKCCALFSKYLGQSPNNYLMQYRLNKSAELLKSGELSKTEIAVSCGFGGGSYFAEVFKKYFGKTPTEYVKGK